MVLETLYALTSNTKIVKEAMAKGQCSTVCLFVFVVVCFLVIAGYIYLNFESQMFLLIFMSCRCSDLFAGPLL